MLNLPHHVWDSLLVLAWMAWFLAACHRMLHSKAPTSHAWPDPRPACTSATGPGQVAMREGGWSIETWMMRWNELIFLFK